MDNQDGDSATTSLYSWMSNLEATLNSAEGTKALESYLIRCDSLALLEFIWACDGMKSLVQENPEKGDQLVSCIYKNYIVSGALPILSNNVVLTVARKLEQYFERPDPSDFPKGGYVAALRRVDSSHLDMDVFDEAKMEVESHLKTQVFPQFQNAVQRGSVYVASKRNGCSSGHSSTASSTLASQPEAFARALCEKLEGLRISRENS